MNSKHFDWKSKEEEVFRFFGRFFNIAKAKELIQAAPRELDELELKEAFKWIAPPPKSKDKLLLGMIYVDYKRAESSEIDITFPIIVCPFEDAYMPIDGWHRIAKARLEGKTKLPCVVLTGDEAKIVRKM